MIDYMMITLLIIMIVLFAFLIFVGFFEFINYLSKDKFKEIVLKFFFDNK